MVPGSLMRMDEAFNRTRERRSFIIAEGYEYEEIWECEFHRQMEENPRMKAYIDNLEIVSPLNPRGCFFGGRVNPLILYKQTAEDEVINYADFVSLYPTVLKQEEFPLGHPRIFTEGLGKELKKIRKTGRIRHFGVMKCNVSPPKGLYLPLLPARIAGKLMFALCRTCAEVGQRDCNHTEKERELRGEWVTVELQKALDVGYRITKIFEVWHYSKRSNPSDTSMFFGAYVDMFLKSKVESTGYPNWVKTEEDKDRYIQEFEETEGIALDKKKIAKNPGLRSISKLCLNSFWGKFGQKSDMSKVEYCKTPQRYFEIITDPANIIQSIQFCGDDMLGVAYKEKDAYVDSLPNTNVIIASFTTAWARLRLYGVMEKLGRRLCYSDTDSVVYIQKNSDPPPILFGSRLGSMTDELEEYGEGAHCTAFVGCAPKAYAMRIENAAGQVFTMAKVKGFSLNYEASLLINFDSMVALILKFLDNDPENNTIRLQFQTFLRTNDHKVLMQDVTKMFSVVYTKRVALQDGSTLPYGY